MRLVQEHPSKNVLRKLLHMFRQFYSTFFYLSLVQGRRDPVGL